MTDQGFLKDEAIKLQETIDQHLCVQHGFAWRPRFAESMERTYKTLASRTEDRHVDELVLKRAYEVGMSVFEYKYMPLPGALRTLQALRDTYRISVVTKGDQDEQRKKIVDSGVDKFIDDIHVVSYKDIKEWQQVIDDLQITGLGSTWAIGNSPKSDVNVPLRMGMNAIHVDQGGWVFEKEDYETPVEGRQLIVVAKIDEVLNHINWS